MRRSPSRSCSSRAASLLLSLPLALPLACGPLAGGGTDLDVALPGERGEAIINGGACEEPGTETAVAILVDALIKFGDFGEQPIKTVVCTGTLIAPDVVLTAAHCLDASALTLGFGEVQSSRYYVTFSEDLSDLSSGATTEFPADAVEATGWVVHENFNIQLINGENVNGPGNFHDVGLIFLSESVDGVEPEIVLTPEEGERAMVEGAEVTIAGWGQQQQTTGGPLEAPPEGTVGIKRCGASFINEVGSHEIQVGGDASTTRKCHGDSGGPSYAVIDTEHARASRVVGITSHAYDAEDCNKGGVDTRVDTWFDWIDGQMAAACEDGTRSWCELEGVIPASYYDPPKDDDKREIDPPPPALCRCLSGDSETAPPTLALLAFGALALFSRRRRRR